MYQMVLLLFRVASASWRNGPMWTSAKSCTWEEIKPYTRTGWWLTSWRETWHKVLGDFQFFSSWAAGSRELSEGWGKKLFFSSSVSPHLECCMQFWLSMLVWVQQGLTKTIGASDMSRDGLHIFEEWRHGDALSMCKYQGVKKRQWQNKRQRMKSETHKIPLKLERNIPDGQCLRLHWLWKDWSETPP